MARRDDQKFSERMHTAAKARAEMLEKAKARAEAAKVNFAATAGERIALAGVWYFGSEAIPIVTSVSRSARSRPTFFSTNRVTASIGRGNGRRMRQRT